MRGKSEGGNAPPEDKVPGCCEGQPDVPQAAEAHEEPDEEDNASAVGPAGKDTEGDAEDGT